MKMIPDTVLRYLKNHAADSLDFWTVEGSSARPGLLAACDTLYSLRLSGQMGLLAPDAGPRFVFLLSGHSLAGGIGKGQGPDAGTLVRGCRCGKTRLPLGLPWGMPR